MRDGFESYRAELEGIQLSEESKRALTESLKSHSGGRIPAHRPRRLSAGLRLAAVVAVICLLTGAGVAAAVAGPTLGKGMFGSGAGYGQSSGFIGRSIEKDGWTVTITDCVGDDLNLYVGLELEAPEGTVLDAEDYFFGEDHWGGQIEFTSLAVRLMGMTGTQARQLPDDDPTDNRLAFVTSVRGFADDGKVRSFNGQGIRIILPGLYHSVGWDAEREKPILVQDCAATWDFGRMTVSYPDSTIHLEPNVPVTTLDVEAVVTSIDISPLCTRVRIEGDALKGHHDWVPKNAPDGFYGCIEYQEITLYDKDGGAYSLTCENCDLSGSGCSGGTDTSEDGFVDLRRAYGRSGAERLVDVENLEAISICGVMIPIN